MESEPLDKMEEFMAFGTILDEQGINTVGDFLGLAMVNPEGVKALLDIDGETLGQLIVAAKDKLSDEELKKLEETEIKKVGEDYKLGMLTREGEEGEQ
jgi:hypothetical protein